MNPLEAHLVTTGLGPVYDGIGHLVLSPEDWVPVLALGLFVGLRGDTIARKSLLALPLAWLSAGLVGGFINASISFPVSSVTFLILGLLIATDLALPSTLILVLTVLIGGLQGCLDGIAMRPPGGGALGVVGSVVTATVILAITSGFVVSLKAPWTRIVVRVIGSWIAATGLLLLGWWLKRG
jgi:hydrogenase/urease accessory protein HupE